jgi:hypothetical protein
LIFQRLAQKCRRCSQFCSLAFPPGGQRNRRQLINRTFAARADGVVIALRASGELNILYGM